MTQQCQFKVKDKEMIEYETDVEGSDILKGGGGAPIPGVYHCQVDKATEHGDEGFVELECTVVSPGTECGKTFRHRCYFRASDAEKSLTCRKISLGTAIRLGLTTQAAYEADKAAGRPHGIEWMDACGKQFIGDLKGREYERQDGSKGQGVNASFYAIDGERARKRVASFDTELLSLIDSFAPTAMAPPPQQPQHRPPTNAPTQARQQTTAPAAPAAGQFSYDDI